MDNTRIRSSLYTVYSQPDISDVTSPRVARGVCDSWRRLKFKLFYSPPFFPPGWGWRSPLWFDLGIHCDVAFFFLSVCGNAVPPLYFQPKPNLSKTLEGLLMRLVIFVNTIFQPNSLNITVSVCYVSGSKVNREEKSRPYVCVFVSTLLNISISEHLVSSCQCDVWSLKRA